MQLPTLLSITPIYIALLGLLFIPFTLRAGLYRVQSNIFIGTGDDPEMLRRIRGQGNFVETVPIALLLLVAMELVGAKDAWLHVLGIALILGRICHHRTWAKGPAPHWHVHHHAHHPSEFAVASD